MCSISDSKKKKPVTKPDNWNKYIKVRDQANMIQSVRVHSAR